jgi:hypothetical protein
MLPAIRTLASAKLAWHLLAETVAPGAAPTTHLRVVKGVAKQVVRRAKKLLSNGAKITGELIIQLVRQATQRLASTPTLWSQVVMTDAGVPELPPLYTNGVELGQKRGLTDRTIRTHIQELKKAGLITRSKYRGTNASYCLWINPDFVWETASAAPKSAKTSTSESVFLSPSGINLPLIEVLETTRSSKSAISQVEKLVTHREVGEAGKTGIPFTGSAGPQRGSEPGSQVSKSGAGGAGTARAERFLEKAAARGTGAREAEKRRNVEWFWSYAKAVIYKGKVFNAEAERQAKNAIWFGVFGGFLASEPADWDAWRPGLQRRIELAGAWLARNPSCYPAAPYAEVLAGCGYFDAGNNKGFARTLGWWRTELAKRQQGAVERALDEALTELHQRRRLDAGQRRVQASRRARQKDLLELHRFHHTKLARLGGDDALLRLAARLQAEHLRLS